MKRSLARLGALLAATVLAACTTTTPSDAPSAPSSVGPGATAPVASEPADIAGEPTALDLLTQALMDGTLDEGTALLYRLYAEAGDDRLPAEYEGPASDDPGVGSLALAAWPRLSSEQRAAIEPFLVRPTSPRSVWAPVTTARAELAAFRQAASTCQEGFLREQVSPTIPIVVWGQCAGRSESDILREVGEAVAYLAALWGPMTLVMGPPIPDQNVEGDEFEDSPEAGDGLLDVYLVDRSVSAHGRGIQSGSAATTRSAAPRVGAAGADASSAYIVVNRVINSGPTLKSTLAHELFHALQMAHNNRGTLFSVATPGGGTDWERHWFVEASAVWAEHEFVSEARSTEVYPRFTRDFQSSALSLSDNTGSNEYASFGWPLFMRQELGAASIGAAWVAIEGKDGFEQVQQAVDGQLSFTSHFRDFAVRAFNENLQPGDPAGPRFQVLDGSFPLHSPDAPKAKYNVPVTVDDPLPVHAVELPGLRASYTDLVPAADVRQVELDFAGLAPAADVDVDLLLKVEGEPWARRAVPSGGSIAICDVEKVIVVLSNHNQARDSKASGSWEAVGLGDECDPAGAPWTVTLTGPHPNAGTYTGVANTLCTARTIDGAESWTASMVDFDGPITTIDLSHDPDHDSVSVVGPGGIETGVWAASTRMAAQTATVSGSGAPNAGRVIGDGSFTDSEGHVFTIHAVLDCSETFT